MKLSDLAKGARPIFAKFEDLDTTHAGVITEEPAYQEDRFNPGREELVIILDSGGVRYALHARGQMIEAIIAAVIDTKAGDLHVGGWLSVTFVEYRGKAKIYKAVYEEPDDDSCACADPQEPIGVAALEFDDNDLDRDSDDPDRDSDDSAPLF